jgi:hypothetical protein
MPTNMIRKRAAPISPMAHFEERCRSVEPTGQTVPLLCVGELISGFIQHVACQRPPCVGGGTAGFARRRGAPARGRQAQTRSSPWRTRRIVARARHRWTRCARSVEIQRVAGLPGARALEVMEHPDARATVDSSGTAAPARRGRPIGSSRRGCPSDATSRQPARHVCLRRLRRVMRVGEQSNATKRAARWRMLNRNTCLAQARPPSMSTPRGRRGRKSAPRWRPRSSRGLHRDRTERGPGSPEEDDGPDRHPDPGPSFSVHQREHLDAG